MGVAKHKSQGKFTTALKSFLAEIHVYHPDQYDGQLFTHINKVMQDHAPPPPKKKTKLGQPPSRKTHSTFFKHMKLISSFLLHTYLPHPQPPVLCPPQDHSYTLYLCAAFTDSMAASEQVFLRVNN